MAIRTPSALRTALLAGLVVALAAPTVEARPGGGSSSGSRGSQTNSAPPPTATAPGAAQPMQRTQTPATAAAPMAGAAGAAAAAPSRGLGFGGGLMAGMLGAGLLGMMFGGGFLGGLGGLASMLGLLLQVALIGGLIFLAVRFFRRRSEPATAAAGAPSERSSLGGGAAPGGIGSGLGSGMGGFQPRPVTRVPVEIVQEDYGVFERVLGDVQTAYGREDVATLHRVATPEMVRYFEEDLAENRTRGIRNEVSAPKLLQGDLSEAWREGSSSYATVAMRFEIIDAKVELATGRVVEGSLTAPVEATEIWTFRREGVGNWMLSAIQQTA